MVEKRAGMTSIYPLFIEFITTWTLKSIITAYAKWQPIIALSFYYESVDWRFDICTKTCVGVLLFISKKWGYGLRKLQSPKYKGSDQLAHIGRSKALKLFKENNFKEEQT